MNIVSEARIAELVAEEKSLPSGLEPLTGFTLRNQHHRKDFKVVAPSGNEFLLAVRRSALNVLDFSVILGYQLPHLHTISGYVVITESRITIQTRLRRNSSMISTST
jgi:hypothetical protein